MFRLSEIGTLCTLAASLGFIGVPRTVDAQLAPATPDVKEEPASSTKHGKILRALRVATPPPTIDGRLDDPAWERAESAEGFVQWEPNNMAPLSERTAVQVAYDDRQLGLGTQSTLSATVNPDFGQVEADPAVLNLSVFETFFPEKRPFFLEDSRTLVPPFGLFQLFHSRRIGGEPSRFEDRLGDSIVEQPAQTSVLGAAKITGKTSGWTYGALSAATTREYAQVDTEHVDATGSATKSRAKQELEPLTSYNVVRVQRDINSSSNIGGIATAVIRDGDDDALTGGIDYTMRWNRNRNQWNGHWAVTRAAASDRTNGLRTDFGGVTNFSLTRKHWGFFTHFDHFGRNFRVTPALAAGSGNPGDHLQVRPRRSSVDQERGRGWRRH